LAQEGADARVKLLALLACASCVLAYDGFVILAAVALALLWERRFITAAGCVVFASALAWWWSAMALGHGLGTLGNVESYSSSRSLLALNINAWKTALYTLDGWWSLKTVGIGTLAFAIGGMGIGPIALAAFAMKTDNRKSTAGKAMILIGLLMWLAIIFIVPQMTSMSPTTGMQPRLAFLAFPAQAIALGWLCAKAPEGKWAWMAWVIPIALFAWSHANLSGFASFDLLFDYGAWKLIWR
jgi:hypothetical protein